MKHSEDQIQIGDSVKIRLDEKFGEQAGWYEGIVTRIEPYSTHRSFYWIELSLAAQALLKIREISVFNPNNLQKLK